MSQSRQLLEVKHAMLADLDRSQLMPEDLYVEPRLKDLRGDAAPGYLLRYPDFRTGKPNGYARFRYLPECLRGFRKLAPPKRKYDQPPKTKPHAYFPKYISWPALLTDINKPIFFTEGEKKAAAGAKAGFPVIGLGGVWSYKIKDQEELLPELLQFTWEGRKVYLVWDSDAASNALSQEALDRFAELLTDFYKAEVHVVILPSQKSGDKNGLDDYLISEGSEAFAALIEEAEEWRAAKRIYRSDLLHRAVRKAERILSSRLDFRLFRHGSELVHVIEQECVPPDKEGPIRREQGASYLAPLNADNVDYLISKSGCVFTRTTDKNGAQSERPSDPKSAWAKSMLANFNVFPEGSPWKQLRLVSAVPLLLLNGELVDRPGFDERLGVWFDPRGYQFPEIPARPSKQRARAALDEFAAVYEKFPFATGESKHWNESPGYATVLATILSILIRHLLPTVPMLGISAPEAGSGKTKIAESIAKATTGFGPTRLSYDGKEEFEKLLPAVMRAGDRCLMIDNITQTVHSPKLAQVLTTGDVTDFRVLGESRAVKVANHSVVFATGNGLILSSDLPRRALLCRLVPGVERPESRVFSFDPVARAHKLFPKLVTAALTALRYYFLAGCPQPTYQKQSPLESGSFEDWNRVVRGLLVHLGFGDALATQAEVRDDDTARQADLALVEDLHLRFGLEGFTTGNIGNLLASDAYRILCDREGKWNPVGAGIRLGKLRDRPLEGLLMVGDGREHGHARFKLQCLRGKNCVACGNPKKF